MPRAISMRHTTVPSGDLEEFQVRARRSRAHYAGAGCHYWLFEEPALPGVYVEFFEAADADTLMKAHRNDPAPILDSQRLYVEVELN